MFSDDRKCVLLAEILFKSVFQFKQKEDIITVVEVTNYHINLPPFLGKVKVKLPSQVFSLTMSATTETFI